MRSILLSTLLLMGGAAFASGLQVSPVTLTLSPTQAADGLWLSNTGDNVVNAQVRVFRWTQENDADQLALSEYEKFRPIQDAQYKSDLERLADETKKLKGSGDE